MTPERVTEILNTESTKMPGFKLIEVGSVRDVMTSDEIDEVNRLWIQLPGSSTFHSALSKIAKG